MRKPLPELTVTPSPEQFTDFAVDHSFLFMAKDTCVGQAHINIYDDDTVFIEWVEIPPALRGQGYLSPILLCLMRHFGTDTLVFESSEDHKALYEHLGAVSIDYDDIRDMTTMELSKEALNNHDRYAA